MIGCQNAINKSWLDLTGRRMPGRPDSGISRKATACPLVRANDDIQRRTKSTRFPAVLEVGGATVKRLPVANLTPMMLLQRWRQLWA